jgi:hypothetical protein
MIGIMIMKYDEDITFEGSIAVTATGQGMPLQLNRTQAPR